MRKRYQIALAVLMVAGSGLVALHFFRPQQREPVYQGKALRAWLCDYLGWDTRPEEWAKAKARAEDAVRHIGTNAIPVLLELLREKDSSLMSKLVVIWDRHIERISYLPAWVRHPAWYKNQARCLFMEGEVGFKILGAEAQQAVPELMSLYEQTFSNDSVAAMDCQISISRALVDIGPPAISSLLRWANSSSEFENALAVYALSQIHAQPSVVVPVLVRCLGHTNSYVRMRAAEGLGNFGREASQAVPPLVQALSDPVKPVRSEVTQALKKIDPEALAQASVK